VQAKKVTGLQDKNTAMVKDKLKTKLHHATHLQNKNIVMAKD
jgi:hypothetical protein